jgi:hypothetical protein
MSGKLGETERVTATEPDSSEPVRVLIVRERSWRTITDRVVMEALDQVVADGGISLVYAAPVDTTLAALSELRETKEESKPFDIVVSGLDLPDSPVGGLQIADAVGRENLASYFILFNQGIIPQAFRKREGRAISAVLSYPTVPQMVDALNNGRQSVLSGSKLVKSFSPSA